jgi:hypothetical protein
VPLWRGYQTNIYHQCQRCGRRQPLDTMQWQGGLLICTVTDCVDGAIVGSRDVAVAKQVSINRKELTPEKKLYEPRSVQADIEILFNG